MHKWMSLAFLLLAPGNFFAQSHKSAVGGEASLSAGAEFSVFNSDWNCSSAAPLGCGSQQLFGVAPFLDLDIRKFGAEGEARWLHWNGPAGEVESNYLVGPRYRLFRDGRFDIKAKFMLGGGWLTSPGYPGPQSLKGSYFAFAPGATLNYHIRGPWTVRADYEYEIWPNFIGLPGYVNGQLVTHKHPLTPNGVSFGIAYTLLGR